MSALAALAEKILRPGGDPYVMIPELIFALPSRWRRAALEVARCLIQHARRNELDEKLTTRRIAEEIGRSISFVQKGLYALQRVMEEHGGAIIDRIRVAGRRIIRFVRGLASREKAVPPAPPKEQFETASTEAPASTSPLDPINPDHPLIARGMALIPDATPERIAAAIGVY